MGKSGRRSPGLWTDETSLPPPSPVRAWELNDAFVEGMALLQIYSIEAAGGVESVLQTAAELAQRREQLLRTPAVINASLGSRLRDTVWKGFTNQLSSPNSSPDTSDSDEEQEIDDGDQTETPPAASAPTSSGLTSRWANVVWRGITNQEPPPSPISPLTPAPVSPSLPSPHSARSRDTLAPPSPGSLWNYADKFKDSDTAATLAKVGTNWRVKAMQAWSSRGNSTQSPSDSSSLQAVNKPRSGSVSDGSHQKGDDDNRRSSLPGPDRKELYSPPARPAFFRPPRDSWLPQPRRSPVSSPTKPDTPPSAADSAAVIAKGMRDSLASFAGIHTTPSPKPEVKKGPRPLLLSTSSLITGGTSTPPTVRPPSVAIRGHQRDWSEVLRSKPHLSHRGSQSSLSSMSDVAGRSRGIEPRSNRESDATESRVVPLHRASVSPMAPAFRTHRGRPTSPTSSSDRGTLSPSAGIERMASRSLSAVRDRPDDSARRGWSRRDIPDSPHTIPASPPPPTPPSSRFFNGIEVTGAESQRGSMVLTESNVRALEPPVHIKKIVRKKTPPPSLQLEDTSDSSFAQTPSRSPRARSKRNPARVANLRIQKSDSNIMLHNSPDLKTPSPNTLAPPEWPEDHDSAMTPRATMFDMAHDSHDGHQSSSASPPSPRSPKRVRKISTEGNSEGYVRTRKVSSEGRVRKVSNDIHEGRMRKISADGHPTRTRKVSTESREPRRTTESAAEEGDDEGYDDLLSAYESEDNAKPF